MITIWHNPRCSKSRQALALLEEAGADVTVRKYLEDAPTLSELQTARTALGIPPVVQMIRTGEKTFKEAGLSQTDNDDTLLKAMATHPILIERPMVFRDGKGVIGRPPENVHDLL